MAERRQARCPRRLDEPLMSAVAPLTFQPGEIVLNKYEIIRPLGSGQFGDVFHVINQNLGRESALKLIRVANPVEHRAVVEAQAQSLCGHDHVVKVLTADVFDGAVLIEMEYLEGGSLADRLLREFVPVIETIGYLKQILFALEHAHNRGIVHRDVKPGNIMLTGGIAKLSDFGTVIHPESGVRVTDLFYRPHASPEAMNNEEFSAASDVFAAGMTLLRAVNNMTGWDAVLSNAAWPALVKEGKLANLMGYADHMPPKLKRIIRKAINPVVAERYPTAAALRQELERLRPARRWIRLNDNEWTCTFDGREERALFQPGTKPSVEYTIGGRRRRQDCQSYRTEREARTRLAELVARSTLA
ncbi:MAG: serine/threonine-protein kinase [Aurantimonas endophytica]|uniref:serine/threonine-protein kinase n=1 Tax=Aurantimonas endophytica TaxID=1522175 RepID=UPI0030019A90